VREDGGERGEQAREQRLVHEAQADPLHEHAVVCESFAGQLEELFGVEMGGARGPGVRRLRDDRVVASIRQQQSAARVIDHDARAPFGERVDRAFGADLPVRDDHLLLELHDVHGSDTRWHAFDRHPAAEPDHQQVLRVGTQQQRKQPEPALLEPAARNALGLRDGRFGKSVGEDAEGPGPLQQQHRRGATHREEADLRHRVGQRQGGGAQQPPRVSDGRQREGHGEGGCAEQRTALAGLRQQRRDGGDHEARRRAHPDRAREAETGQQQEGGTDGADDRSDGVPGVHAGGGARRSRRVRSEHAHGERKGGADAEGDRQQHRRGERCIGDGGGAPAGAEARSQRRQGVRGGEGRHREQRDAELRQGEARSGALGPSSDPAPERAAERDPREEAREHGGEGVDAAAEKLREKARPEHFVGKGNRAGEQHHGQDPVCRPVRRRRFRRLGDRRRRVPGEGRGRDEDQPVHQRAENHGLAQPDEGQQQEGSAERPRNRTRRVDPVERADPRSDLLVAADRVARQQGKGRAHQSRRQQQ
jgi:hypothetical protein